jgi:hypothetical protein
MVKTEATASGDLDGLIEELFPTGATATVSLAGAPRWRLPLTARVTANGLTWAGSLDGGAGFALDIGVPGVSSRDAYGLLVQLARLDGVPRAVSSTPDAVEIGLWAPDASDAEASCWSVAPGVWLRQGKGCRVSFAVDEGVRRTFPLTPAEVRGTAEALASARVIEQRLARMAEADERAVRAALGS